MTVESRLVSPPRNRNLHRRPVRRPAFLLFLFLILLTQVWDTRVKQCQRTINTQFPALGVQFNKTGDGFFTAGIDNSIHFWDLRKLETNSSEEEEQSPAYSLSGHQNTITSLSLSPDGNFLLSNSMDCTLRVWDVRPYAEGNRNLRLLEGINHSPAEKGVLKCGWGGSASVAGNLILPKFF
jgi:Prp8 binding protein